MTDDLRPEDLRELEDAPEVEPEPEPRSHSDDDESDQIELPE